MIEYLLKAMLINAVTVGIWIAGMSGIRGRSVRRNLLSAYLLEHLSALVRLGLPVISALSGCSRQLSRASRRDIEDIQQNLSEGMLLGDALVRVPRPAATCLGRLRQAVKVDMSLFPSSRLVSPAESEALRLGEMGGDLARALDLIVCERRRFEGLRTNVITAFLYPLCIMIVGCGILSALMGFVVPRLQRMFYEMDVSLPLFSQGMILVSAPIVRFWWAVPIVLAGGIVLLFNVGPFRPYTRGRHFVRDAARRVAFALPFYLGVMRRTMLAEFCSELAMLVRAGAPFHRALRVMAEGTMNPWFRDRIARAAALCERGEHPAAALDKAGLDPRAAWFSRATDDPADLADALHRLAEDYRARTSWAAAITGRLLPPLVIIAIGLVVGCIAVGMFLPLIKLAWSLSG